MADSLRFAVIGTGRFAKHYIRLIQETSLLNLLAIASRTKEGLARAKDLVAEDVFKTINVSDAIKKADCVVIATPPSTHFEIAKKAILLGKHVLVEKPTVSNLNEGKKLLALSKKSKSVFMTGHQYVYDDYIRHLKKEIKSLGNVNLVYAEHLYPGPMRDDIGCLWDAGTHALSIIQYLLSPGKIVNASGTSLDLLRNNLDDFTSCNAEFQSGLKASINVSWMSPNRSRKIILFGDKKTAVFDDLNADKLKFYDVLPKAKWKRSIYSGSLEKTSIINADLLAPQIPKINANDSLRNQLEHFSYCIRNNKESITGMKISYEITNWLDFISRKISLPGY